ncbi:hypothetical protein JKP88DRAFT_88709 [Tribonema minus]|uniref:TLDc domain-containing protein n=1 Tax=Tribonema minus TaxID=303371 RepID=A0A835YK91_9STRA|nr:hypothetical protein JKP88DRAFT_88709 [Tribonema minus]
MMAEQQQDIVERFFGFVFGQKALDDEAPMGMKRMTIENFPDQYPATKDRWADPVAGDTKDMALFRPALAQTMLEKRKLKCVYDAARDGWRPAAFHRGVDKKGPGVVLARTAGGAVVGGYNPKGWVGESEYRPGLSAFLFTWPDGDTSKRPVKLRKVGGAGLACYDRASTGPFFGSEGLCVPLDAGSGGGGAERVARCKLGAYYERMPDGGNSMFAPGEKGAAQLTELKAFVGVYAKDEEIPFDDVIYLSFT